MLTVETDATQLMINNSAFAYQQLFPTTTTTTTTPPRKHAD